MPDLWILAKFLG